MSKISVVWLKLISLIKSVHKMLALQGKVSKYSLMCYGMVWYIIVWFYTVYLNGNWAQIT